MRGARGMMLITWRCRGCWRCWGGRGLRRRGICWGILRGGGLVCFVGVLLALLERGRGGRGQVVEANMVDGVAGLASMMRLAAGTGGWSGPRGTNLLDGGAPFYGVYETRDGRWVAVGALEARFYAVLLQGLGVRAADVGGDQMDRATWGLQREVFAARFRARTRAEWEAVFDGVDACCTPVLEHAELRRGGFVQRPIVTLRASPGLAVGGGGGGGVEDGQGEGVEGGGWVASGLAPGEGGEEVLAAWVGWERGREYVVRNGGLEVARGGRAVL